jgi:hypothetical protein
VDLPPSGLSVCRSVALPGCTSHALGCSGGRLDSYGEDDELCTLSDFAETGSGEDLDLTSWQILEYEDMPASWDRSASSEIFKLALELRTQAVLHHCKIEDGSFDVDEAGWSAALRTAFEPLPGSDKETKAKNKLLRKRHDQLEAHSKPTKKAALKQFAVNHLRADAENQLHQLMPTLAEHFPTTFLEQVDAEREPGSRNSSSADAAAAATTATPATVPAMANSTPARGTRSSANKPARPRPEEPAEEILEEQEELVDDDESDESPPPRFRRQQRRGREQKKGAASPGATAAAGPSPTRNLRRSARKATRSGTDTNSETLSAATVASAGLPSRVVGLNELRDASGLEPTDFLQVWHQQHPEVRNWLDMVAGDDCGDDARKSSAADVEPLDGAEGNEESEESQQDASEDASNRPQQLQELKAESARLRSLGGDDPLASSLAAGPAVNNGFGFVGESEPSHCLASSSFSWAVHASFSSSSKI